MLLGGFTGAASRVLQVFGLYEVLAALTLSLATVAVCHLLRARPLPTLGAALPALLWLGAHHLTDAALFRLDQGQAVVREAESLAEDFLVAGADTPLELVDAGLAAETGVAGTQGALIVQLRAGVLVRRALGDARVLPVGLRWHALVLAVHAAFVLLVVRRALLHLRAEPVCAVCDRYLRRVALGQVDAGEVARLAQAWQDGTRTPPQVTAPAQPVALIYEERCPAGHTLEPGFSAVRLRRKGLARSLPGPIASLPAVTEG